MVKDDWGKFLIEIRHNNFSCVQVQVIIAKSKYIWSNIIGELIAAGNYAI